MPDDHQQRAAADPEVPEQPGPSTGELPGEVARTPRGEDAEGTVVDAEVGHQNDKRAVAGDPTDEPQPWTGTEPPADIEQDKGV